MAKIGFLGAGKMGSGMVARLLQAGHTVKLFNRTASKIAPLVSIGAIGAVSPFQAATDVDVVISMVGDDCASREVWMGENGALRAARQHSPLLIECSTLSHDWVVELSNFASDIGSSYIDCPVTGLPDAAARGQLTLFLGGDKDIISRAQNYLVPISDNQIYFGDIGAATAYKLIVNLMGSIQIAATAEALLVAQSAGLDLATVASALGTGGAGSPTVARVSELMVGGEHEKDVLFSANWRLKDTKYAVDFAQKLLQGHRLGSVAHEMFQELVDAGFSNSAETKIIDTLDRPNKPNRPVWY